MFLNHLNDNYLVILMFQKIYNVIHMLKKYL